jgi:hypothetical protein
MRLGAVAPSNEATGCQPLAPDGFLPDGVVGLVSSAIMVDAAPGNGTAGRHPPPPVGFLRLFTSTILFTLVSRRLNMSCDTLFVQVVVREATFEVRSVIFFSKPSTVP